MKENENDLNLQNEDELFVPINQNSIESEKIIAPRYSYWKSVFRIFFKKKMNILLIAAFVVIFIVSFAVPLFAPYDYLENVRLASSQNLNPQEAIRYFEKVKEENPLNLENPEQVYGPWIKWILGTGPFGNSIFYGVISSSRTSLLLAVICASINMSIGIVIGAVWGYSKRLDAVMIVIYNIIANVPELLLLTVLVYIIGSGFWSFVFALTVTGWLGIAYFFRTQVMIIRDREYSLASRCLGTPIPRMISKNILPFLTSVIVTLLATHLPSYISYEVFLSYIGVGLSAKIPSLGRMIEQAQSAFLTYPWEFWPPVFVAAAITIILYLLGQNLADASDPRTHM